MNIVCLDLEGVLVPEIWKAVAARTGISALNRTTRDEPDYDVLMRYRLCILDEHRITLPYIQEVISTLRPLPGASDFLENLRSKTQVVILSDTFAEFGMPLMKQLGWPTLLCHELIVDSNNYIINYRLRQEDQKRKAVHAFQSLSYKIIAAGDSYNDLTMLESADHGILFCPPDALLKSHPQFPVTLTHTQLFEKISQFL